VSVPTVHLVALLVVLFLVMPAAAYEIGHTTITLIDPARGNRSIPTEVYYPADVSGEGVPVASDPEVFPVVTFGHGYLMSWSLYSYVHEALVPEGYIVTYPDTGGELFPDHEDFGLDMAFIVQSLRGLGDDTGSPFYGRVSAAAAVAGHSMGGGASLLAAASDPTISAIVNLAAAETNPSAINAAAGITMPALLFSGGSDCVASPEDHQIPMYDALASDCRTRVTISGASHCQFAESSWLCELGEGGCPDPTVSRAQQQQAVVALLLPWLDYTLKDDVLGWFAFDELLETMSGIAYEQTCSPTDVPVAPSTAPLLSLAPSFPNPTSGHAFARFHLARPADTSVRIYSISGRLVAEIDDGRRKAGWHTVTWDGTTLAGVTTASSVYYWRVEAGDETATSAIVRVR